MCRYCNTAQNHSLIKDEEQQGYRLNIIDNRLFLEKPDAEPDEIIEDIYFVVRYCPMCGKQLED